MPYNHYGYKALPEGIFVMEMLKISIFGMSLKIIDLRLQPHLPWPIS